jgi:serine/threonine protein kinase
MGNCFLSQSNDDEDKERLILDFDDRFKFHAALRNIPSGNLFLYRDTLYDNKLVVVKNRTQTSQFNIENPDRELSMYLSIGRHPNIIYLLGYSRNKLQTYFVFDYYSRGDLIDHINAQPDRRLSEARARVLFKQILEGVRFLHLQNISHLDLSLENIILDEHDTIKIIDFGQAQRGIRVDGSCFLERNQKITCRSPEVQKRQYFIGSKADIWSLGIILWVMLTGRYCYRKPEYSDRGFNMMTSGKKFLKSLWLYYSDVECSDALLDLFAWVWDITPENRPTTDMLLKHEWMVTKTE